MNKAQGRRKGTKAGKYLRYKQQNRRIVNKIKRLVRWIARNPNDICASEALKRARNSAE